MRLVLINSTDHSNAASELGGLLRVFLRRMPPSSHPTLALLRLHALMLTPPLNQQTYQTAISSLAQAYTGAIAVYPHGHPTLAIILAEWGKLLSMEWPDDTKDEMMKRLMEAVVVLREATGACERGFGVGGGLVGREIDGLLRGCEGELALLRASNKDSHKQVHSVV